MDRPWGDARGAVVFDVVTTMADRIAFDRHMIRKPESLRRLGRIVVAGCVAVPIVAFAILLVAKVALAGTACDLDEALDSQGRLRAFLQASAGVALLEAIAGGAILARRDRVFEATTRAKVRRRPGVDPADPELREPSRCSFDPAGFRIDGPGLCVGGGWSTVHGFEETADHMFLLIGPVAGFIMAKRDLPPATVLAVRDLVRAQLPGR